MAGDDRPSLDVPTKSGVLGIVAGALGISRESSEELARLDQRLALAVRVDHAGPLEVDFQTVEAAPDKGKGKNEEKGWNGSIVARKDLIVSRRQLLHDTAFTALLVEVTEGAPALEQMALALRQPRWLPFLGRRACAPSEPLLVRRADQSSPIFEASNLRELFALVPRCALATTHRDRRPSQTVRRDLHVEDRIAPEDGRLPHKVRDGKFPRGVRLFAERTVMRVPAEPMGHTELAERTQNNTVDEWI